METWGNLSVLVREAPEYVSPEELRRLERVAVGRVCRCGDCVCCQEWKNHNYQEYKNHNHKVEV